MKIPISFSNANKMYSVSKLIADGYLLEIGDRYLAKGGTN